MIQASQALLRTSKDGEKINDRKALSWATTKLSEATSHSAKWVSMAEVGLAQQKRELPPCPWFCYVEGREWLGTNTLLQMGER